MPLLGPIDPLQSLAPSTAGGGVQQAQSFVEGIQQQQVRQAQLQAAAQEQKAGALQLQQQQEAAQRQTAFRAALIDATKNPTSEGFRLLRGNYPEYNAMIEPGLKQVKEEERQGTISQLWSPFVAAAQGRTDLMKSGLQTLVEGYRNSKQPAKAAGIEKLLSADPVFAAGVLGGMLEGVMGKEDFEGRLKAIGIGDTTRKDKALANTAVRTDELGATYDEKKIKGDLAKDEAAVTASNAAAGASGAAKAVSEQDLSDKKLLSPLLVPAKQAEIDDKAMSRVDKASQIASRAQTDMRTAAKAPFDIMKIEADARKAIADANAAPSKAATDRANAAVAAAREARQAMTTATNLARQPMLDAMARDELADKKANTKIKEAAEKRLDRKLPPSTVKLLETLTPQIVEAKLTARRAAEVSKRLDGLDSGDAGIRRRATEAFKAWYGSRDGRSQLDDLYNRLSKGEVMKVLGPLKGSTSDKDLVFAEKGIPPASDSPEIRASFIRGIGKVAVLEDRLKTIQKEWASANDTMGTARDKFKAGGFDVEPGMTYEMLVDKVMAPYLTEGTSATGKTAAAGGTPAVRPEIKNLTNEQLDALIRQRGGK